MQIRNRSFLHCLCNKEFPPKEEIQLQDTQWLEEINTAQLVVRVRADVLKNLKNNSASLKLKNILHTVKFHMLILSDYSYERK